MSALLAIGLDGCRVGWVAAVLYVQPASTEVRVFSTLTNALTFRATHGANATVAIDIPIGLPDRVGLRPCDELARRFLGPSWPTVFQVPDRDLLGLKAFEQVQALVAQRRVSEPAARCLSQQAFHLLRKIEEVDSFARHEPTHEAWFVETHPEVAFRALTGRSLPPKKTHEGLTERTRALRSIFRDYDNQVRTLRQTVRKKDVGDDDIADSYGALWSAVRLRAGSSKSLGNGTRDSLGLAMRIVF